MVLIYFEFHNFMSFTPRFSGVLYSKHCVRMFSSCIKQRDLTPTVAWEEHWTICTICIEPKFISSLITAPSYYNVFWSLWKEVISRKTIFKQAKPFGLWRSLTNFKKYYPEKQYRYRLLLIRIFFKLILNYMASVLWISFEKAKAFILLHPTLNYFKNKLCTLCWYYKCNIWANWESLCLYP